MKLFIIYEEWNHMGIAEASFKLSFDIDYNSKILITKKESITTESYQSVKSEWNKILKSTIPDISISKKEIIKKWFTGLLCHPNLFFGYPIYYESNLFSESEFNQMRDIAKITIKEREEKAIINAKDNELIRLFNEYNLSPRPSLESIYSWVANCPSKRAHGIEINTKSNEWGCGYCRIGGDINELVIYMSNRKE